MSEIAEKNTLKKENVQKCKDHIFNNEHLLDQYEELGEPAEYKKLDPNPSYWSNKCSLLKM